jgi:transcriptional antiterminator
MGNKTKRILLIYQKLLSHRPVNVKHMAQYFDTNERTIQRDIQDIKSFLNDQHQTLLYEKTTANYTITHKNNDNTDQTYINIIFEMTYQLYRQLNKQYDTYIIQRNHQTLKVVLSISSSDAINICFTYRQSLRNVSGETLVEVLSNELSQLQSNYILKRI